jgi:hypothetical protein
MGQVWGGSSNTNLDRSNPLLGVLSGSGAFTVSANTSIVGTRSTRIR